MHTTKLKISLLIAASVSGAIAAFPGAVLAVDMRVVPVSESLKSPKSSPYSISDLSKHGMHFEALGEYERNKSKGLSLTDLTGAARSAWALNLVDKARTIWDTALARHDFGGTERAKALLARSILELQEGNFEKSRAFAEKGSALLEEPSEFRAQFWMLIGETLRAQGVKSQAITFYEKATQEGSEHSRAEALFLLAESQRDLGMHQKARHSYTSIPISSNYAAKALKGLVEIDYSDRDYGGVLTWIEEGFKNHAEEFNEPRLMYLHVTALLKLERIEDAQKVLHKLGTNFSEEEQWFEIAKSAVEMAMLNSQEKGNKARDE